MFLLEVLHSIPPPQERILGSKFALLVKVSWMDIGDGAWWASLMFLCFIVVQLISFHYFILYVLTSLGFIVWSGFQMDYFGGLFVSRIRDVEVYNFNGVVVRRLFFRVISFPDVVNYSIDAWSWPVLTRTGGCGKTGEFTKSLAFRNQMRCSRAGSYPADCAMLCWSPGKNDGG